MGKVNARRKFVGGCLPQDQPMLHKCANPACSRPFLRLDQGKLFQVEMEYFPVSSSPALVRPRRPKKLRQIDRYWLCDECCSHFTLAFEKGHGVVTVPLPVVAEQKAPSQPRLAELHSVAHRTRLTGWAAAR
jgi:hypothetical protein